MSNGNKNPKVRCAIYTRKSTDEGLDREFNTLDAQREAAENYVASQKHQGWLCLGERYDDGGPRRYRYYTCSGAQKHGFASCPSKSIPAMEVEQFVIKEVRNARPDELATTESSSQWLSTTERAKLLSGIVRRVEYDGRQGELKIKLRSGEGNQPV